MQYLNAMIQITLTYCYTIIHSKIELSEFIHCKYTSVIMLRAGQLSALVNALPEWKGTIELVIVGT